MKILCLFFLLQCPVAAIAQEDEKIADLLAGIAENSSEEEDLSELSERLANLRKHPINLNKTTPEELKSLFFLSPVQINNFFSYTATNKLLNILELQAITGFDVHTINNITPFVTLSQLQDYQQIQPKELLKSADHDLIFRYGSLLQQQKGFKDLPGSRYLGSAEKLLFRYRYNFQQVISAALILEKDAGEQLYQPKKGPDHMSAHLAFFKLGRISKLIFGDYSLQFGQGLTLWSGFAFGKGPDVTSVAAKDVGLKPYTSANEASFLRGMANTINLGSNMQLSTFISFRRLDASLKTMEDGTKYLTNINITGLHRTQSELKNQKSLQQKLYGSALQYIGENLSLGIIGYHSQYEHAFITGTQKYNLYSFTGKSLTNAGINYNYTFKNVYLYGELAHSIGSGTALVNGVMASLSAKASVVLLYRNYTRNYHNFLSRAVGEGTETNNEKGWYMGLNYRLPANLSLSLYADYFNFPWLKYRVNEPSSGQEIFSQLSYIKGKTFRAALRFKRELKQQNPESGSKLNELQPVVKQNYRLDWSWKIDKKLKFSQRTEIAQYQKGIERKESGQMAYIDINYSPLASRISGNLRLAFFSTPSYNSRIYAYESDVLYASNSGVYSEKGLRSFINIRYKLVKKMDIWGRYSIFKYQDTETIGSGLDEITGNIKSELKFQLRYQF